MREACLKSVFALAQRDERVVFVGSDLGVGVLDEFKAAFPERFFMEGVYEQNLVGLAAGLAMEGRIVYLNTIATFLTRRCYEQIAVDLCLHNVNVRLIANGGGRVYAPLGPTHLAIEDLSIMRALPNMTVVAPADEPEMVRMMNTTLVHNGPMYIRVAKGTEPKITQTNGPFVIGQAVPVREGKDALICCTGVGLHAALPAVKLLEEVGIRAAVLHFPTVKPLDTKTLFAFAEKVPLIITVEENTLVGGFGSAVLESLSDADLLIGRRTRRLGIPDVFPNKYGDQAGMLKQYGVSAETIAETVRELHAERSTKRVRKLAESA
jgi:transketolase